MISLMNPEPSPNQDGMWREAITDFPFELLDIPTDLGLAGLFVWVIVVMLVVFVVGIAAAFES